MKRDAVSLCILAMLVMPASLMAADVEVMVIVHPRRTVALEKSDIRAIYLKQRMFWGDGAPILAINREAGSDPREQFSKLVFGQSSRRLAAYWNQRYFEAGEFPPPTLASDEAVLRFVAGNVNAIGYIVKRDVADTVHVLPVFK